MGPSVAKRLRTSKTIWLNVGAMAVAYVLNHQGMLATWGLDADMQVVALAGLNVVNRFFTSQKIAGV